MGRQSFLQQSSWTLSAVLHSQEPQLLKILSMSLNATTPVIHKAFHCMCIFILRNLRNGQVDLPAQFIRGVKTPALQVLLDSVEEPVVGRRKVR